MAIEDTRKLIKVTYHQAESYITHGWTLLAVCVCQDGADQYADYHLGWQKDGEPPLMPIY